MRHTYLFLLLFCCITVRLHAQDETPITLHIGDQPPPLRMRTWLKGEPVQQFEKGRVYVLEFWATWCMPCKAAMPHLSVVAEKYRDKVTIIGVDIYEQKTTPFEKIKRFVDSMGKRMDYLVAAEDSNLMATTWLRAAGEQAIPHTLVINQEGKLAWIGHPHKLEPVLAQIVDNNWDVAKALAQRNTERYLDSLDVDASYELLRFKHDMTKPDAPEKTDSLLWAIDEIVKKEPRLKYALHIGYNTFDALLKTDQQKAYAYGKEVMETPASNGPFYEVIVEGIRDFSNTLNLSPEIYRLGAEAREAQIASYFYPENLDLYKEYSSMAEWYSCANNKPKAIAAMQKAIEVLKSKKGFSVSYLTAYETRLQQYKNM